MIDFVNYLQHRVSEARCDLDDVNKKLQKAMEDRDLLGAELQGYERALAAEMRRQGMVSPDPPDSRKPLPSETEDRDASVSKAEFARQFIRARAETGATPTDIMKGFQGAGIPIKKPYIYALVQRIQKQGAIKSKRGKWFPVPVSEQAANGTAEKALP